METQLVDNDPTMAYKEWQKTVREYHINQRMTEPYSPWQNRAELDVREIKRAIGGSP
jgi:transposase